MLKWTLQKSLSNESEISKNSTSFKTPSKQQQLDRRKSIKKRNTLENKENIITSTPLRKISQNFICSPTLKSPASPSSSPLRDILNLTPTPDIIKNSESIFSSEITTPKRQYALTLPKYEEEYSPNTIIPSSHILAMRGLLPDKYIENPRYLDNLKSDLIKPPRLKHRRFSVTSFHSSEHNENISTHYETEINSSKMGDSTLNRLIDSILDSGRKNKRNKSIRNSLNFKKRSILKNLNKQTVILSPSYTPADDPASDLSLNDISNMKKTSNCRTLLTTNNNTSTKNSLCLNKEKYSSNYFEIGLELPSIHV